jgi:hypothetical protein
VYASEPTSDRSSPGCPVDSAGRIVPDAAVRYLAAMESLPPRRDDTSLRSDRSRRDRTQARSAGSFRPRRCAASRPSHLTRRARYGSRLLDTSAARAVRGFPVARSPATRPGRRSSRRWAGGTIGTPPVAIRAAPVATPTRAAWFVRYPSSEDPGRGDAQGAHRGRYVPGMFGTTVRALDSRARGRIRPWRSRDGQPRLNTSSTTFHTRSTD